MDYRIMSHYLRYGIDCDKLRYDAFYRTFHVFFVWKVKWKPTPVQRCLSGLITKKAA